MDACKAELIVDLTSSGELHQQFGQSGGEQQSLSGVWKPPDDLLKLLSKTHFKQPGWRKNTGTFTHTHMLSSESELRIEKMTPFSPVCLIKHHVLHIVQFQVHILDDVHETTGGTDDSGGKAQRSGPQRTGHGWGETTYQ